MASSEPLQRAIVLLHRAQGGDPEANDELFTLLCDQLRKQAQQAMVGRVGHTLQPTALVHEMWLRLGQEDQLSADSGQRFLRLATKAMRSLLVDHARPTTA